MLFDAYRRMSSHEKLQTVVRLNRAVKTLNVAGLRQRFPYADEHELEARWAAGFLDAHAVVALFGWDPRED